MTPRLDDLINEWRKDTAFCNWSYTKVEVGLPHPCGYLHSDHHDARGLIQVWTDHVMIIVGEDTLSAFQASEYYKRYLKEMTPPSSNQWIRVEAANPAFFDVLGHAMEIIDNESTRSQH